MWFVNHGIWNVRIHNCDDHSSNIVLCTSSTSFLLFFMVSAVPYLCLFQVFLFINLAQAQLALLLIQWLSFLVFIWFCYWFGFPFNIIPCLLGQECRPIISVQSQPLLQWKPLWHWETHSLQSTQHLKQERSSKKKPKFFHNKII